MSFRIVKTFSIIFILFLSIILSFGFFLRTRYINPVLMYHFILDTGDVKKNKLIVTPSTFEKQMHFLKVNNYNVISLEEFANFLKQKKKIPRNTVVITLDDGHLDKEIWLSSNYICYCKLYF